MADGTCSPAPEDSSSSSAAEEQQQEVIAEPVVPAVASEPVPEPVAEPPSQSSAEPEGQPAEEPQQQDEQPKQEEQKQEATEEQPKEERVAEKEEVQQGSRKCYTREELQALNKDCTHKPDGLDLSDVWLRDLERTAASPDPDELAIALKPQWGRAASGLQPGRSLGLSFGRSVGSPNGPTAPIHSKLIDLGPGPEHADPLSRQSLDGPGPRPRIDRFGERDLSSKGTWRQATDAARELDDRGKPVEVQRSPFAAASTRPDPPAVGRDTKGRWERGAELKDRERADSWRAAGPAPPQPRTRWDDAMHARRRHEGMEGGPTPGGPDPWAEEGTPSKSLSMGSMRRTMTTQEMEREHQEFRERARAEAAKRRGAPPMGDPALIEMDMDELMDDEQRAQKYGSAAGNGKSAEPAGDQQHASSGPPQGIKISFQELAAKAGKAGPSASSEQPAQAPSGAPAAASLPIRVEELEARLGATSISSQPPPAGSAAARGPPPGMGPLAGLFNQQQQQQPAAAPAVAPGAFQGNAQASQALLGLLKKSSGGPPGLGTGAGSGGVVPAAMAMPAMADSSAPPGFGGPAAAAPAAPVAIAASTLDTALNPAAAAAAAAGNGLLPTVQAVSEAAAAAKAKPAPVGGLFNATGTASIFGGSSSFGSMAGAGAQGIETLQKLKALWGEAPAEPPKQDNKLPTVSGFALPTATALPEGIAGPTGGLLGAAASQQQAAAGAAQPTNVQQMFAKLQQQQQQQQQQPQQQAPGAGQAGAPLQALLRQLGQQQQQQWQQPAQQPGPGQQPPSDMGLQAWQQAPSQSQVNAVDAAAAAAAQRTAAARLAAAGGAANATGTNAQEFFQQFLAGARNPAAAQQQQQQQQRLLQASQQPGSAQGQPGQQAQQQGGGAGLQQPPDLAHFQQWMQQASGPGRPAAQVGGPAPGPATPGAQPRYSYGQPAYGAPGMGGAGPQQPQQQPPVGVQPSSDMQALMQRLNKQPVVGPPGMPGAGVRPTATAATGINPMTGLPYGADQSGLVAQARNQALMQNLLAQMRQQQPQAQPAAMQAAGLYPSAQHAHLAAAAAGVPKLPGQVLPGGVGMGQQQHLMAAMAQQPNSDMQRLLASLSGGMMPQQQPQQHAQAAGLHGLSAGMPVSDLERYLMAQAQR